MEKTRFEADLGASTFALPWQQTDKSFLLEVMIGSKRLGYAVLAQQ